MCLVEVAKNLTAVDVDAAVAAASADQVGSEGPERLLVDQPDLPWTLCSLREAVSLPSRGPT